MGLFTAPCVVCGASVRKKLRYCPECGGPGPRAEFACPRCNGHNTGPTKNCVHCGERLLSIEGGKPHFARRPYLVEKTWARYEGDFAVRLHVQDVQGLFTKWVVIEEGTRALVFQNGRFAGDVGPGKHDHTGLARRFLASLNLAEPAVFILVDAADVTLEISCACRTSENLPVTADARVVVSLRDPLAFFENLVKGQTQIGTADLQESLRREVETGVQAAMRGYSVHDLVGNLKLRDQVLDVLTSYLKGTLNRYGLALVDVSSLEYGPEDDISQEILDRARDQFKAEAEAALRQGVDVKTQAEHQIALKDEARRQELKKLADQGDLQGARQAVGKKAVTDDYEREAGKKDQEQQLEILRRKREADLQTWEAHQEAELRMKQKKLEMYAGAPPAALAAILDGGEFERLMKVEELRMQEKLPPDQMLIFVAGRSPDVARALAAKYVAEGSLKQDRVDKLLAEQKAQDAEKRADGFAEIAAGRQGAPCPSCGRPSATAFCPYCGVKRV